MVDWCFKNIGRQTEDCSEELKDEVHVGRGIELEWRVQGGNNIGSSPDFAAKKPFRKMFRSQELGKHAQKLSVAQSRHLAVPKV